MQNSNWNYQNKPITTQDTTPQFGTYLSVLFGIFQVHGKPNEANERGDLRTAAIAALNEETNSVNTESEMTSKQRREANLGIVLVSISVMFILCQSVKIIPDVYEVLFCRIGSSGLNSEGLCNNHAVIDYIIDISHLLLAINSSANVIIYTLRGL